MNFKKPKYQLKLSWICGSYLNNPNKRPDIITKTFQLLNDNTSIIPAKLIGGFDGINSRIYYPELAKRAHIEGILIIDFTVDNNGNAKDIIISKSIGGMCDEIAIQALKSSKFIPTTLNGKKIGEKYRISILFELPEEEEIPVLPFEFN